MKICIECGRQLFDDDEFCDKCNSKNIIPENEYNNIVEEIKNSNIFKRKKLLQKHEYKCIYNVLRQPEASYPKPIILNNVSYGSEKEYWKRINQHTLNNNILNKSKIECPYCHSEDTKKITTTSKAVHTALFGIFSISRNSKQWHCNKCNSDF